MMNEHMCILGGGLGEADYTFYARCSLDPAPTECALGIGMKLVKVCNSWESFFISRMKKDKNRNDDGNSFLAVELVKLKNGKGNSFILDKKVQAY